MKNTNIGHSGVAPTYAHSSDNEYQEEEINFSNYAAVLLENKWIISIITVMVFLMSVVYVFLATPVYKVDAMLRIEDKTSSALGALDDLTASLEGDSSAETEIAILRSRRVVGGVVDSLSLDLKVEPKHFPLIGSVIARHFGVEGEGIAHPWFGLSEYAWGGEAITVETLKVPRALLNKTITLVAGQSGNYRVLDSEQKLLLQGRVGQKAENLGDGGEKMRLFVSSLKARPETRFLLTQFSVQEAINRVLKKFTVSELGNKTGVLSLNLTGSDQTKITKVLNAIANTYLRQNVESKSAEAKKSLAFLEKQLPQLKVRVDIAELAYNEYRTRHGSIDLTEETRLVLGNNVKLDTEIMTLQQEHSELRQRFKPTHPMIRALSSKIDLLKSQQKKFNKKTENLPGTQQEIVRLAREAQASSALYTTLLNTSQQLRIAQAGTVGSIQIIDYAIDPDKPFKPKKLVIVAISSLFGLLLGVMLAFLRQVMRKGVKDPDEVERQLGIPVFASVLHSDQQSEMARFRGTNQRGFGILAQEYPNDQAVESLRSLKTTLHFTQMAAKNNMLLITGPSPDVGKSFVSVNLGALLAKNGKTSLVVDADLRKGMVHKYIGVSRDNGLSEMIVGGNIADINLKQTGVEGFQIITSGELPPNPSDLLLHDSFGKWLERLSAMVDYLIIDAPPILAVTDAAIIGRHAAVTLMVGKAGKHTMRELSQSVKRLQQANVHVNGWIFNDLDILSSQYKYTSYVYHYDYTKQT